MIATRQILKHPCRHSIYISMTLCCNTYLSFAPMLYMLVFVVERSRFAREFLPCCTPLLVKALQKDTDRAVTCRLFPR